METEKELIIECAKEIVNGLLKVTEASEFSFLNKDEFLASRSLLHEDGGVVIFTDRKTLFYITSLIDLVSNMDDEEEG